MEAAVVAAVFANRFAQFNIAAVTFERERRRRRALVVRAWLRKIQGIARARERYCINSIPMDGIIWRILQGNEEATKKHLRVSVRAFHLFASKISRKRHGWALEFEVAIFLFWLACGTSYRVISATFEMPRTSVFNCIKRVIADTIELIPDVIRHPEGDSLHAVGEDFARRAGSQVFRNCVGSIDGTHIRIFCPNGQNEAYINRKLFYSIQMQAVCDGRGTIIDLFTGFPGSVHDSRVLRHSSLYINGNYPPPGFFIIGDGGYPCTSRPLVLITPFRAPENARELCFNNRLSKARIIIEQVFGMMKVRWRSIFTKTVELKTAKAVKVIACCAVMHNICITAGDILTINIHPREDVENRQIREVEPGDNYRNVLAEMLNLEQGIV